VERPDPTRSSEEHEDDPDALGYRNVDEEADYDERGGTQGPGPAEPPSDEETPPA
jgi:hypothetical protein